MSKSRFDLLSEIKQWGTKLARTNNRLSKREIEAFHAVLKEVSSNKVEDAEIDQALKEGRQLAIPTPRYAEVDSWIS